MTDLPDMSTRALPTMTDAEAIAWLSYRMNEFSDRFELEADYAPTGELHFTVRRYSVSNPNEGWVHGEDKSLTSAIAWVAKAVDAKEVTR